MAEPCEPGLRNDALIRLLEARSIGGTGSSADSALADLRALRSRTYAQPGAR